MKSTLFTSNRVAGATTWLAAASMACALFAGDASGDDDGRRVLVDRELEMRTIRLLSLTSDAIVYEDEQGRRRQATVGGFVALLPTAPAYGSRPRSADAFDHDASPGSIELIDGQRFPGEHAPTGGDEEMVVWTHPVFGRVSVALDRVAEVVLDAGVHRQLRAERAGRPRSELVNDELLLINGDTLSGFVISLGDPIEIEIDGAVVSLAPERVASVRLAGTDEPMSGLVVWLEDGSVAVVTSMERGAEGAISLRLATGQSAGVPIESVRAMAFDAGRIRALASYAPVEEKPIGRRVLLSGVRSLVNPLDAPVELNAPDIEFPGPMEARWLLPGGVRRFAAIAELPLDAQPWGDCELVIKIDGEEKLRERLWSGSPRLEFSLPFEVSDRAREMIVIVDPGRYGPVNDRVILRRPLLLVDPAER
ncbi:MAG: hypothetical protein EA376_02455 [Phycisphaeraceae bacterium]|nr:MAG: hypothetical protein EA376_02455 [Phycisphaeraceae bacterium]